MDVIDSGALFSPDRHYRYKLWRQWAGTSKWAKPCVMFIGLNPSTANELKDDPTIRRCMGFANKWGYGGMFMGNLYGLISKDPKALEGNPIPIEQSNENFKALLEMSEQSTRIIAAWGSIHRPGQENVIYLRNNLRYPLFCLGVNQDGQPKHPLYLPASVKPVEWKL